MRTINRIAKITLQKIYKNGSVRAINFLEGDYDLDKVIDYFDTRIVSEVKKEEESPFLGNIDPAEINPNNIYQCFVWGVRLGLREVPLLMGSKSMANRIIYEEAKNSWVFPHGNTFSHLVIERVVAVKDGYQIYEVDVYRISEAQWKVFYNAAIGFETLK